MLEPIVNPTKLKTTSDITDRMKAEAALKESEARLSDITLSMADWVWEVDENGVYTYCSPKVFEILALSPENVLGKTPFNFMPPDEAKRVAAIFSEIASNKLPLKDLENWIITNDGKQICLLTNGVPILDKEGNLKGYRGVDKDITERKMVIKTLTESEEKYRVLLNGSSLGILAFDIETHQCVFYNSAACKLFGYREEEITRLHITDFHPKDSIEMVIHEFELLGRGEKSISNSLPCLRKDGKIFYADIAGHTTIINGRACSIGFIADATERKQLENSALQTRLLLDSIIEHSPNAMWISDEYGTMIRLNQACRDNLHLKDDEVIGKYNLLEDNLLEEQGFMPMVRDVFEKGVATRFTIQYDTSALKNINPERTIEVFIEVHISAIVNSQGKVTNAIIQHVDITEQKETEEKLRESKQIIEGIINTIPAGVFWKDKDLNYLGCNLVTARDAGFSDQKEVIGKNDFQMGWRNRAELYRIDDLHVIESESSKVNIEEELTNAAGETVTILTTKIPLKNSIGEVTGVLGTYVDITERKRAEEKIFKSEVRYRNIINTSPVPMALNDEQQNITLLNPAFVQTFGYSMEDIPTLSGWWSKAYHDSVYRQWVADNWQSELQKSKQTGAAFKPMELTVKCKNGTDKTVLVTASSIFNAYEGEHLVVLYDITDRKKAEEKLHEKDVQFRKLSSNLPDLIYQFTRRPDGTYCVPIASEGIINIFGCLPEDVVEDFTPIGRVIYPEDSERVIKDIEYSAKHLTYFTCEFRVQIPNKPIQWIFSRSTPEKLADGSITWYGFNANITDMKQTEAELIKAKEKAEESDRLKSSFLANMSHEIRTPMNGILGFAQLLKEPNLTGKEQQEYIRIIEKSGKRMLNIIHDIVDISKIESGQMEVSISETNTNDQIEYIYDFFAPEIEKKGLQLFCKKTLPASESIIKTDREKIYAILTNLVKNAVKYTNEGLIEVGYMKKNNYLEFFVKDTGIGIAKDRQEAIFERFIQADISNKRAHDGAGLGLSIAEAYVEMLGGKIWVESEEGKGSTFYFTIPYNIEPEGKIVDENIVPADREENQIKNLKILIAEDDEASEQFITMAIKKYSNEILNANTGVKAIEACRNNADINLILMDIRMPEMNGYEATRQIRDFNKDVIIIAQTAYGLSGDRQKALNAGCNDYISKPIDSEKLLALIQKYFNK